MFSWNIFFNSVQDRLDYAIKLESSGKKQDAFLILKKLVKENPNCKPCKFHMVRIASELERVELERRRMLLDKILLEAEKQ